MLIVATLAAMFTVAIGAAHAWDAIGEERAFVRAWERAEARRAETERRELARRAGFARYCALRSERAADKALMEQLDHAS